MATVNIGANLAPLQNALNQTATMLQAFAGALGFGGVIEVATDVMAALRAIADYTRDATAAAADYERQMAVFANTFKLNEEVIGGSARALAQFSEQLSKTTTIGVQDALKMTQAFTSMGNITSDRIQKAMQVAADTAATKGKDALATAEKIARALENPASLGPFRREKIVEAADLEKIAKKAQEGTPQSLQAAQDMLLKAIGEKTKGAAAAMANTWSGAMDQVRNELDNVRRHFGEILLPVLKELVPIIRSLVEGFSDMMEYAAQLMATFVELVATLIKTSGIVELLAAAFDLLKLALFAFINVVTLGQAQFDGTAKDFERFIDVMIGVGTVISGVVALIVRSITWLFNTVKDLLSDWSFKSSNESFNKLLDLPKNLMDDMAKNAQDAQDRQAEREKRRRQKENQILPGSPEAAPTKLPQAIPPKNVLTGTIESLTALHTRISEAAGKSAKDEANEQIVENTRRTADGTDVMVAKLDTLIDATKSIETPEAGQVANA